MDLGNLLEPAKPVVIAFGLKVLSARSCSTSSAAG